MTSSSMTRTRASAKRQLMWLMLLGALVLGAGLGMRDPSPPDEPRFVLAAKHMVESGDWLIPRRGAEFYAHKPATFMWAQAVSYLTVRNWQIAFLLPSFLSALGTMWLTYDLGRRMWSPRVGIVAGLALMATVQFGLQAKRAQIDMMLVFLTTFALWGLVRHLLLGPNRRALFLGAFAAGLGTVTKGVGFLPLLVLIPWWASRGRPRQPEVVRPLWLVAPGFLLGAAVWALPVLLAVWQSTDPALHAYAQEIFFKQTGERYANAWHHIRPAWYYLQVVATLWLPGALLLPWLIPAWWRRLRRGDIRWWVLLGWSALVFLFFSASPGKREVYIFPALPAVCIAAAPLLAGLLRRRGPRLVVVAYVFALSLLAIAIALDGFGDLWGHTARLAERRDMQADDLVWLLGGLMSLALAGFASILLWRKRPGRLAVGFSAVLWCAYGTVLAPALDASSSARQLMQDVGTALPPGAELGLVAWKEQMLLQADREAVEFGFSRPWPEQWSDAFGWLGQSPARRWILAPEDAMPGCIDLNRSEFVGRSNRGRWWLVSSAAAGGRCRP